MEEPGRDIVLGRAQAFAGKNIINPLSTETFRNAPEMR
jgi:hypothetical protein